MVNTVRGKNVNTARPKAVVNVVQGNNVNVVKALACWIQVSDGLGPQKKLIFLSNVQEYEGLDEGYVAFGGNPKGKKIIGKRTPTLSFMRPFGYPITILNTIDHLGKFDGKADEGFFIRRIVEENLHIRFGESTPNVVGDKTCQNYILLPLWPADPPFSQDPKSPQDDVSKPLSDDEKKVNEDLRKECKSIDQEKDDNGNSTNNVNAASINEANAIGGITSIELPDDPNMPALEDISMFDLSRDNEDVGAEADIIWIQHSKSVLFQLQEFIKIILSIK
ncbi:hypothetical protein Tco_0115885 [Tanacetum coccineum]